MRFRVTYIVAALTMLTISGSTALADTNTTGTFNTGTSTSGTYNVTITNSGASTTSTVGTASSSGWTTSVTGSSYTINAVPLQPLNTATFPLEPLLVVISNDTGFPSGVSVHFQSSNPQIVSVPTSATTDSTGAAVVNVKAGTKSGSATITISVGNEQKTVTVQVDASSGPVGANTSTGSWDPTGGGANLVLPNVKQDATQLTLPADDRTQSSIVLHVTNKGKPVAHVRVRAKSSRPDVARVASEAVSDTSGVIRIGVTAGRAVGKATITMTIGSPGDEMDLTAPVETTQTVTAIRTNYPAYAGISGPAQNVGSAVEEWDINGVNGVTLHTLRYNPSSNQVAVQGVVRGKDQGEVYIQVVPDKATPAGYPQFWGYSIPTRNGTFSATITLPYHGGTGVGVFAVHPGRGLDDGKPSAYARFTNPKPTLSLQQLGLLESWAANYTEATKVAALAKGLSAGSPSKLDTMRRISDWVSRHIAYDWVSFNHNTSRIQQASFTLDHRVGVCEDETALGAAMLREVGIPAQFIYGSAGGGPHAWLRAWDGHAWITLDPTWDQVYYQGTRAVLPVAVTFKYFDPPIKLFAESHHYQGVDSW